VDHIDSHTYDQFDRFPTIDYICFMGKYKTYLLFFQISVLAVSCVSAPDQGKASQAVISESADDENVNRDTDTDGFNQNNVSQEYYLATREEVQLFINKLNDIIKKQDYNAWVAVLSPEYFSEISSEQYLTEISELPAMKTRRITLKKPEDYFIHVVVPSRANSRVDEIEFISMHRVKAFTVYTSRSGEEQKLLLYYLEKNRDLWRIIN